MKKLKIGYIIKYFHPIKGGAENYILNLALQAVKDGHEVHVFTSDRKGKDVFEKHEDSYEGIHIHRCRSWFDLTHYLGLYPSLLPKLLHADLDIIHASGFGFLWHDLVLILKKLMSGKTRFINTPHGPFMALRDYSLFLKVLKFLYTKIQKLFLNWLYDVVLGDNTFQWQWIVSYGIKKDKITYVPVGISKATVSKKILFSERERFVRTYQLKGKKVCSYLGRISKYKGLQHVIRVFPKLVKQYPDSVLLVMGRDDGYLRSLKVLAGKLQMRPYIRFIEDIPEEEKLIALEVSDIFIFPSQWEAFGIVMLEAMTRGNALISTKTEGGKFLITEGVNGFLMGYGKQKELLKHLTYLLSDATLLAEMKKENRKRVQAFTWETIYQDYYRNVLDSINM